MDLNWKRDFLLSASTRLENFVGIKYHVRTNWPAGTIALHNFENGYCGISRIEDGLTCLCYLTRAGNLKKSAGQIEQMEKNILAVNPHLKNIFENAQPLPGFPVTISQISFSRKEQVQQGVLMLGDAAGMITPLCGNGMSIALRTGKMAATLGQDFFQGYLSRQQMKEKYQEEWQRNFSRRLWAGRKLQGFFGSSRRSNFFIGTIALFPFLSAPLVRLTHGQNF
jgi:2-polyprenyl-6-methoxyphenol hydroxylase-like FAD-dependent oxidoreductase